MTPEIIAFEADCVAAGVSPAAAFKAGALNPSTWFRWKSGAASPTLRSLNAARQGLDVLKSAGHGRAAPIDDSVTVAPDAASGAGAKTAIVQ